MREGFERLLPSLPNAKSIYIALGLLPFLALCIPSARAQQRNSDSANYSDLTVQNLDRVGASAAEIKAVLLVNPGLLVELKRWFARDAAEHGQILKESDLSNDAVFARLENDAHFRSVATSLVQRYGYLVPKLNPDSELGMESELRIQERAKWLAQYQPEEFALGREGAPQNLPGASSCVTQGARYCTGSDLRTSPSGSRSLRARPGVPPTPVAPPQPSLPSPPNGNNNSVRRAQLTDTDQDAGPFAMQPASAPEMPPAALSNLGMNSTPAGGQQVPTWANGRQSASLAPGEGPVFANTQNGLNATAMGPNRSSGVPYEADMSGNAPESASASVASTGWASSFAPGYAPALPVRPPEIVRKLNPYQDIPSLYDMYVQAVPRPAIPKRFGAEVFENGTRDSQLIPMDLPVGPEYVVGPGDGLSVDLWGGVSQRLYRVVDREGRVSLPEIGPILVSGKSLAEVQQNLQQVLRTEYRDVSADVSLSRLRTIRVYEVGDVANAGAYDISSLSTPLNALFAAGGPTPQGSLRILKHFRGNELVEVVDVYDLLLHGVKAEIKRLENGDTVLVPPIGPQVTVEGMVRRPAIYELKDEKNLAGVLELAGGLLPAATLRHIEVQRLVAHEKQTMLSLDIPDAGDASEATKKLEAFAIQDGDTVRIFPIAPYNQDAVFLEGHVIRPGRYSYRPDMRVTDLISSYNDLLPEPSTQYAEIIHLNAPDFRPSVESFNLADAFADPSLAPALRPMDTLRVFSRFDFENAPTVTVGGDVRMPGTFQTPGQVRLSDAVHLAGGLAPDAQTSDAQVFRYQPDGKLKAFSVSLGQALAGDLVENILLQPRDTLLIHRNTEAVQPASVALAGEVSNPGRYPLTANMRVSDLIRIGGGLTQSADTQTADLTTYMWLEPSKLTTKHESISVAAVLAGDPKSDLALHNGDLLTIRQLPGWNDLGASVTLRGEVKHPGTYAIHPGERLSSVLTRAGGFEPQAYASSAVLQRPEVRDVEGRAQQEMIQRITSAQSDLALLPDSDPKQKAARALAMQQWQASIDELQANPPVGRVAIRISTDINRWRNTATDIEVRSGDTLTIPKKTNYVMITGQVFSSTAVAYRPGRSAKWYLSQAGGPTQLANKKAIFVVRADGSVLGGKASLWGGSSLSAALQPGDTVVVPEKALGGGLQWQSIFLSAQVASSIASTVFIALRY